MSISQNTASGGPGGGIDNFGTLSVEDSTIAYNSASTGGGISDIGTAVDNLSNSTIAGNFGQGGGGGIYTQGTLTSVNVTIANNTINQGQGGGVYVDPSATAALYNTIVDSNTPSGSDLSGTLSGTSSNNLIGDPNADLGPLTNNGGTTLTIALGQGSDAIDTGANTIAGVTVPTTDQRGALRGALGINAGSLVDIGAYEASSSYQVATAADTTETGTLRTGVGWANVSFNDNPENIASPAPNTVQIITSLPITLSPALGTLQFSNTGTAEEIDNVGRGLAVISGNGAVGVLQVNQGVTVTLTDLEITAGMATTGGGIENDGSLTLNSTTVTGNSATEGGGGVNNTGSLTLTGATISGNTATSGGGVNNTGTLMLSDSAAITGNSASGHRRRRPRQRYAHH